MEEVETKVELWSVSVVGQNSEFGSIKDEKADSNEKDKSGSHCISGSAQVQLEGDGRHHEAVCCNCKWLHQMEPAKFNSLLKCIFVFLIASQLSIFLTLRYPEIFRELFFVTNFIFGAIVAVVALCVDVRRPGLSLRLVPKCVASATLWITHYKRRKLYYTITRKLLPHCVSVLWTQTLYAVAWLKGDLRCLHGDVLALPGMFHSMTLNTTKLTVSTTI